MEALDRSATPPNMRLFTDPRQARRIWDVRESSLGVTSHVPGEPLRWEGFEDSAVAPEKLGAYLRDLRRLMQDSPLRRLVLRTLRPRLRAHAHGLRSRIRRGRRANSASSWKRPPTSSSATAARFPVSTETASPAPSFCPKCLAPNSCELFASSSRSGIPIGR